MFGELMMVKTPSFCRAQHASKTWLASVFLLRFGQSAPLPGQGYAWLWGAILLLVGLAAGAWWHVRRRRRQDAEPEPPAEVTTETPAKKHDALMERICQVMEQEKLYLRSDPRRRASTS